MTPTVYALSCAYQVVSYEGILRGIEPATRFQNGDGFHGYWKDLDARVPRSPSGTEGASGAGHE